MNIEKVVKGGFLANNPGKNTPTRLENPLGELSPSLFSSNNITQRWRNGLFRHTL